MNTGHRTIVALLTVIAVLLALNLMVTTAPASPDIAPATANANGPPVSTISSGGPVCPFPPEGPGVCLYCPCPWDYYTRCPEGETCPPLGVRNQMVDVVDLLYLLQHWEEPVFDAGGCIPEPGYKSLGARAMVDLIANWGCECSEG